MTHDRITASNDVMRGILYSGVSLDVGTFITLRRPARRKAAIRYAQAQDMNFPKTGIELEKEILISPDQNGDLGLRQLLKILLKVDHDIIVEGVVRIFENSMRPEKKIRDQEFAGQILEEIKPKSEKDLSILLNRTLNNWDKSIEQLPFWFRDNYGLAKVKECFDLIKLPEDQIDKLETMKWWLQIKANA